MPLQDRSERQFQNPKDSSRSPNAAIGPPGTPKWPIDSNQLLQEEAAYVYDDHIFTMMQKVKGGRPRKNLKLTKEQLAWIVSPETLRNQAGFSLKARAAEIEKEFKIGCTLYQLRRLYRENGITR